MTGQVLLDSSAWFAYFHKGKAGEAIIKLVDSEAMLFVSVLSLFEIKRKLLQHGKPPEIREQIIDLVKKRSIVVLVDPMITLSAAEISTKHGLSTADAIIYATAQKHGIELITGDTDFSKLKGVRIIK